MKYRTLLTGSLQSAVEDIFVHMDDVMECITTSIRLPDILRHIRIFKPDLFIFCMRDESREVIHYMHEVKKACTKEDVAFLVLGDEEACSQFSKLAINVADLYLIKPLTNTSIMEKIEAYFREKEEALRQIEEMEYKKLLEQEEKKKHILVVDDDVNMVKAIKSQLEPKYQVATAITGNLALRFLTKKTIDLILLDYEMPGQNGAQILSILRGSNSTKDIPVIFLTGVSDTEKIKKVLSLNPQGYLLKPVENEKLMALIEKVLAQGVSDTEV